MIPLVAIILGVSIPLSAIIGNFYLKAKKMELEKGGGVSKKDQKLLQDLLAENQHLAKRVENLETIINDPDLLKLNSVKDANLQGQIDLLADEIKKLKE